MITAEQRAEAMKLADEAPPTYSTFHGIPLEAFSKEELIKIMNWLGWFHEGRECRFREVPR